MRSLANWTRLALIALSSCAMAGGGLAHADAPQGGTVPPGWVWQGVWQDGRWSGQWVPGPGVGPGQAAYPSPPPGAAPWGGDPETQRMIERCRDTRHGAVVGAAIDRSGRKTRDRDCEAFFSDRPEFAPSYGPMPYRQMPYGQMPYGPVGYPPAGYMMVPVITGPQAPCVETRTVTTEYVTERRHHVIRAKPHRKEKRVYTGS